MATNGTLHVIYLVINFVKWLYFGQALPAIRVYIYGIQKVFVGMSYYTFMLVVFSFVFSVMYMGALVDEPGEDGHTKE